MISWIDRANEGLLKAAEWVGKNFKSVAVACTTLLVLGAVWAGIQHSSHKKSSSAMAAYAPIERDFASWKTPTPPAGDKKEEKKPEVTVNPQELFTRMVEFVKAQGDVPASQLMILMASEVAKDLGVEKEKELLDLATKTFKQGSHLMDGLLALKKGDLLANQGLCQEALESWKQIVGRKDLGYLHDASRLKMGLCYEKLSQLDEAEKVYNEIITAAEKSTDKKPETQRQNQWAVREAQKLKRALKWSQQPKS
jgi:hypothetical protein